MNSFSMEWNGKWDWENLDIFSSKASESPKKLQAVEWGIGIDEGEGDIDAGSFNLSGGGGGGSGSGGSTSDMGHNSSVKSSISASTDCSSKQGIKTSNFTFEAFGGLPRDVSDKKELPTTEVTGNSPSMEASVGSGEPLIGLKLGKRTYFENSCSGSNTKTSSSFSVVPGPSSTSTTKKTKSSHNAPTPRCQVEGCNLDLSSAKEYHRKHRVCESHSKSSKVVVAGFERRFCQQCSRFHSLVEFDEKKRSCRRRLSDHNARRRKPQQETIQFNSTRLSSSLYDGRQQMSFVLDNGPLAQTRPAANSTWESTYSSKYEPTKGYLLKPEKVRVVNGQSNLPGFQLQHAVSMPNHDSNRLSISKGNASEVFDQGFNSMFSSNVDVTAPDLCRALSLLSNNNSWAPSEPVSVSLQHHPTMHVNPTTTGMPHHAMMHTDTVPQGLPLASSVYWQAEHHQSTDAHMHALAPNPNGNTHFQEIQLFKSPYVTSGFYSNPLN